VCLHLDMDMDMDMDGMSCDGIEQRLATLVALMLWGCVLLVAVARGQRGRQVWVALRVKVRRLTEGPGDGTSTSLCTCSTLWR
jgi:hypothetical protein